MQFDKLGLPNVCKFLKSLGFTQISKRIILYKNCVSHCVDIFSFFLNFFSNRPIYNLVIETFFGDPFKSNLVFYENLVSHTPATNSMYKKETRYGGSTQLEIHFFIFHTIVSRFLWTLLT